VTIATRGNAIDVGDLTVSRSALAATSNKTRGVFGGGIVTGGGTTNVLDYITIATASNAADFGDLTGQNGYLAACSTSHGGL
jgi:hypothetical protein